MASRGLGVLLLAIRNYVMHQSANQAGSLAFSSLLAMFPLLLLVSAAAGFFGRPGEASSLAARVIELAPPLVQQSLQPAVDQLLARRNHALLTIGILTTLWTASSGMQAVRGALNRSYGIRRGLPFWKARIKVTVFTVLAGLGTLAAFSSMIVEPYIGRMLQASIASWHSPWWTDALRYVATFVVLGGSYALLYAWLPDQRQPLYAVVPGALVGAALWVVAAAVLSYTLRSAERLALVYGSFTGLVATLVFLYASATTLIFGAELNSALRERHRTPSQE